jgi:superfamily I DNA/RNA helicase
MMVDAGPGTGKTATLCARIAWLINYGGVNPSHIWVISFTRTAVHELKNRIGEYLLNPTDLYAIRIATIDSYAWSIQSGFVIDAQISGSFDSNIKTVIDLIKDNQGVFEYISSASHLFVDEAQDIVGNRVELVLELINAMPNQAGVTIFCDEAQSIYGFSGGADNESIVGNLPANIRKFMPEFLSKELVEVHRTQDKTLQDLFSKGRELIKSNLSGLKKAAGVLKLIKNYNHGKIEVQTVNFLKECAEHIDINDPNLFILLRSRADSLLAARQLENSPYRLRLGNMPHAIQPWIGLIFWDFTNEDIDRSQFYELWNARVPAVVTLTNDQAWEILHKNFGKSATKVDVRLMSERLASDAPPIECCYQDYGTDGPIIGTIHAAKGREAKKVLLFLPKIRANMKEIEEESRVLYVGATRAKDRLYISRNNRDRLDNIGRIGVSRAVAQAPDSGSTLFVEIGSRRDIEPDCLVGKAMFSQDHAAKRAQHKIKQLINKPTQAHVNFSNVSLSDFKYGIYLSSIDTEPICFLSKDFKMSLKKIAFTKHSKYYKCSDQLSILGVRTIAVSPKSEMRSKLHEPWSKSGFILAPMLVGFPKIKFKL